jgi:DNA-directed RNA polymerase III subunit RPC1
MSKFTSVEQRTKPLRIAALHYSCLGNDDVYRHSVLQCRRVVGREKDFTINDKRLGVCNRNEICATCGLPTEECVGHPGHIQLALPVFHAGYFTTVIRVCRTICKRCAHVLLSEEEKAYYTQKLQSPQLDVIQRAALAKTIHTEAYKTRICLNCQSVNGVVRRVRPTRLIHEKYSAGVLRRHQSADDDQGSFFASLAAAQQANPDIDNFKYNAQDVLDPLRVRDLFRAIPPNEVLLLGMQPGVRVDDLIISSLIVPPVCTRPSGPAQVGTGTRDDDLSVQYNDILVTCDSMKDDRTGILEPAKLVEHWDMLQLKVARLLDAALPGYPVHLKPAIIKSYAQRVKGKHGRFRGNLSGKRVNFSGRSVISPDPNLEIDEIALPLRMALKLTYSQRVFDQNIALMRQLVLNGPDRHPGACFVILKDGSKKNLAFDREAVAAKLEVGDVVERHCMNGDLLIFNRQPSLHRISMMAHRARVLPYRTLRFNECCCAPYNADFDGDEMNIHLVQTDEARAEVLTLMSTVKNVITAKNGEPIIACTQDFLTAAYLITSRDVFLDRAEFTQFVSHWLKKELPEIPPPTLLRPVELWTGKQAIEVLIRPNRGEVALSFEAATRSYTGKEKHDCKEEGYVAMASGSFISGRLDKKLLGGGAKDGLFAHLNVAAGGEYSARVMGRFARATSRWLMNYGFSLGLGDVSSTASLEAKKAGILAAAFQECHDLIERSKNGGLQPIPGMSLTQTLEAQLNGKLSDVRSDCGDAAMKVLDDYNAPLVMSLSGSKGSSLNIAQMMACVGQQTVSGKRIKDSFIDRSLPHFVRHDVTPASRGFVANSFYTGLIPTEFFFHTMAGREGLVDTAVKTAETGYIYRRLMKAMEDLSVKYDYTVRNSKGDIVQLHYGEDTLDPLLMEGPNSTPINFAAMWTRIVHRAAETAATMEADRTTEQRLTTTSPQMRPQDLRDLCQRLVEAPALAKTSPKFRTDLLQFWTGKAKQLEGFHKNRVLTPTDLDWLKEVTGVTEANVRTFFGQCAVKYQQKRCEPGTACGAIAAQSVGEPSTQMTLRTFHFAGVASMSITQGVPRLVEIINANRNIATPVINAPLLGNSSLAAQAVKARVERVLLREVVTEVAEVITPQMCFLRFRLNMRLIQDLQLDITAASARNAILVAARRPMSPMRLLTDRHIAVHSRNELHVTPPGKSDRQMFLLKHMADMLLGTPISGIAGIKRAVITKQNDGSRRILAEGAELKAVMTLTGVDGTKVRCNHVAAIEKVLGIEAARTVIIDEISGIMKAYSLSIDLRHINLLADVMTHRGVVLGITRYGIQKMNSGVLTMASFERTTEHLYDAAVKQRADKTLSVSESIIVGSHVPLGTNSCHLLLAQDPHATRSMPASARYRTMLERLPASGADGINLNLRSAY